MISLLRAELYRMKSGKTLPILCLCIFAICFLSVVVSRLTSETLIDGQNAAFYAPINSMYLLIVVSVLAAEVIAADYAQGLIRNLIITDKKRSHIFMSKCLRFIGKHCCLSCFVSRHIRLCTLSLLDGAPFLNGDSLFQLFGFSVC